MVDALDTEDDEEPDATLETAELEWVLVDAGAEAVLDTVLDTAELDGVLLFTELETEEALETGLLVDETEVNEWLLVALLDGLFDELVWEPVEEDV